MKKITPLNGRVLATSRGIKAELDSGIVLPEECLDDSDICTVGDGTEIIRRRGTGYPLGDHRYIVDPEDVLAVMVDGEWKPTKGNMIVRKCIDPPDESGVVTPYRRTTSFVEILAVSREYGLQTDVGSLGSVDDKIGIPQKMEETLDDWIIEEESLEFIMGE